MADVEDRYAEALAAAITADLEAHPRPGGLARVVIRWFEGPLYLTIHALGADEERALDPDDAWLPLEWANVEAELDRADRIVDRPEVQAAGSALEATLEEGSWAWEPGTAPGPLVAAARLVRAACDRATPTPAPHFAVGVSHFEAFGIEASVRAANPPETWRRLEERGIDPVADL
jgi:hypothetical protein